MLKTKEQMQEELHENRKRIGDKIETLCNHPVSCREDIQKIILLAFNDKRIDCDKGAMLVSHCMEWITVHTMYKFMCE